MRFTKIILLTSLIIIVSIFYLNLTHNQTAAVSLEKPSINQTDRQTILEATIQIYMYPQDSLDALGVVHGQKSLNDALAEAQVEYRYEMGLGTLVNHNGEIILVTHDHWGDLDALGMVQFRNAAGDPLFKLDKDTFKALIHYQDGGTMILGRFTGGDQADYFEAMIWTSKAKYSQKIHPVDLESGVDASIGQELIIVRQGRHGSTTVNLIIASIESIEERWGQQVYKLRNANGENIMPGDSGGGLWLGSHFIGNMWKSQSSYGWDWDEMALEKQWTETSYAAGLPDFADEVPQF